jgi:superfamily I DNA and/or RNA helicase
VDIREEYGIREEYEVFLQLGQYEESPRDEPPVPVVENELEGIVARIEGDTLYIGFPEIAQSEEYYEQVKEAIDGAEFVHIGELLNKTVLEREESAVRSVSDEVLELFCGDRESVFDPEADAVSESEALDEELYENDRQSEAITKALEAQDIFCIQGPPGTGKTRVIVELARRFIRAEKRVLITAETHQAVSNILVGDSEEGDPDPNSLHYHSRINGFQINRVNPKPDKIGNFERQHYSEEHGAGHIFMTTNNSAATIASPGTPLFDVAIIDEATQARQTSTFIPTSLAEKTILVGDHKQLGPERPYTPEVDREPPNIDFNAEESAFTQIYDNDRGIFGSDLGVMFDTQYRMCPEIAQFPSEEFYSGNLTTGENIGNLNNLQPILGCDIKDRDSEDVEKNSSEALAVVEYVERLVNVTGVEPSEIGIAAAYRDQVSEIETLLRQTEIHNNPILVNTFDSFQGSERSVMVLSFTRSNGHGSIGYLGGESGKRRLNVAMTRAKYHCVFFGDWDTLTRGNGLYQRLRNYIEENVKMLDDEE